MRWLLKKQIFGIYLKMDTETELRKEAPQVEEVDMTAPETIVVKRRGRPTGARNKTKAESSSTAGTIEAVEVPERERTPDPLYSALMKRLDTVEATMKQSPPKVKKERAPRRVAMTPPPAREPAVANAQQEFCIQGSPRTASRQLMEHLQSQQLERASARERMYQNFLPI